jgi:hypothetical protein
MFQSEGTNLIDAGALPVQPFASPAVAPAIKLIGDLPGNALHRRALQHRFIFCPLLYARTYFGGHHSRIVTKHLQLPLHVMRADTSRWHCDTPSFDLAA